MKKHPRCDQLGICLGLSAHACPDCATPCESATPAANITTPANPGLCTPDKHPLPTYPFAPGIIEGPPVGGRPWVFLSAAELAFVLLLVLLFAALGGLVIGAFA